MLRTRSIVRALVEDVQPKALECHCETAMKCARREWLISSFLRVVEMSATHGGPEALAIEGRHPGRRAASATSARGRRHGSVIASPMK
jgi:hypothetical protein